MSTGKHTPRSVSAHDKAALETAIDKLTRRVRAVEQILARIHDVDMGLARVQSEGPPPPRLLVEHLHRSRQEALAQTEQAWQRLEQPAMQRRVRQELRV